MTARIPLVINSGAIQELQSGDTFNLGTGATLVSPVITGTGTAIFSQVNIVGQGDLRLEDTTGGEYVALQAPTSLASSYTLTLPIDDGTNGQALITDGNGNLSWSTPASGDVYGPASATSTAVALFDGTTGKLIKNSGVTIDGSNNVSGVAQLNATTVDLTNLEVTNIKAKDGTASITLADSTGVATFSANPIISSGTANGVAYLNGSKVLTTGSALTFDGTSLIVNGSLQIPNNTGAFNITNASGVVRNVMWQDSSNLLHLISVDGAIGFYPNNAEQMRLTSTGLGIGVSNPSYSLDVQRTFRFADTIGGSLNGYFGCANTGSVTLNFGGTTTPNKGRILYSDNVDSFLFYTNSTERMRLDSSGNLGLGVTPSAWGSGFRAFEVGKVGSGLFSVGATSMQVTNNYYYNGSNYIYAANGAATRYHLFDGKHIWYQAPSGTAGNAISFTQAMTLDASGNLVVGATNTVGKITGYTTAGYGLAANSNTNCIALSAGGIIVFGTSNLAAYADAGYDATTHAFKISGAERMRIDSSGNVGIGIAPSYPLQVRRDNSGSATWVTSENQSATVSSSSGFLAVANGAGNYSFLQQYQSGAAYLLNNANSFFEIGLVQAQPLVLKTNNTERMRIDSSGNVGIGTSSPDVKFQVSGTSGSVQARMGTDTTGYLEVNAFDASPVYCVVGGSNHTAGVFGTQSNTPMVFCTNNTERMRIDSSGNLLVGTTGQSPTFGKVRVYANGMAGLTTERETTSSVKQVVFYNPNGEAGAIYTSGSGTIYATSSDHRLKENIQPMQNALATISKLNPVTYNWKADGSDGQGFIAHELQAVVPDCVTGEKDAVDADGNPVYQGIDTSFLVATLTKAIQEQQKLIEALTARVAKLEGN